MTSPTPQEVEALAERVAEATGAEPAEVLRKFDALVADRQRPDERRQAPPGDVARNGAPR